MIETIFGARLYKERSSPYKEGPFTLLGRCTVVSCRSTSGCQKSKIEGRTIKLLTKVAGIFAPASWLTTTSINTSDGDNNSFQEDASATANFTKMTYFMFLHCAVDISRRYFLGIEPGMYILPGFRHFELYLVSVWPIIQLLKIFVCRL